MAAHGVEMLELTADRHHSSVQTPRQSSHRQSSFPSTTRNPSI